ncbi:hypothetical protein CFP66_12115 [Pseudonocardia sp. MH-G8]|nr:hypothetical protein CFP66_12115 [Pseudonocardia sp. MH-G8]
MSGSPSTSSSNSSAPSAPTLAPAAGEDAPATAQTVEAAPEPEGPEAGTIPQGEWIVGDEVAPGRYRSAGAETGIFELCSVFVNDESGSVMDFSTGNEGEQVLITIPENAATVSNSGCVPFRPVG